MARRSSSLGLGGPHLPQQQQTEALDRQVNGISSFSQSLRKRDETSTDLRELAAAILHQFGGPTKFARMVRREYKRRDNGPQFRRQVISMILRTCEWSTANSIEGDEGDMDDETIDALLTHAAEDHVKRQRMRVEAAEAATYVETPERTETDAGVVEGDGPA